MDKKDTWVTIIGRKICCALIGTPIKLEKRTKGVRVKSVITIELGC